MNKGRRKQITLASQTLDRVKADIEALCSEEQAYFDNIPDSLLDSEKGQRAEEAIDSLENAIGQIEEAIDNLDEAQ